MWSLAAAVLSWQTHTLTRHARHGLADLGSPRSPLPLMERLEPRSTEDLAKKRDLNKKRMDESWGKIEAGFEKALKTAPRAWQGAKIVVDVVEEAKRAVAELEDKVETTM